jgi:hypothetical protein
LFVNHYGSSEIYTFTVEPRAAAKPGSAGKPGLSQRIRVIRLDADSADARAITGENGRIIPPSEPAPRSRSQRAAGSSMACPGTPRCLVPAPRQSRRIA